MADDKKVKAEISKIGRDRIHSGKIIDVLLDRQTDPEGNISMHVYVIFDNKSNTIDAKETVGMNRIVRDRLSSFGENTLPIFYYVAKSEAGKLN